MAKLLPLDGGDYYAWKYLPSLPASVLFCVLYGILTIAHSYRLYINRLWFCIPFAVGGFLEVVGYAVRSAAYSRTNLLPPYIVQSLCLLLPPACFAASVYMVLKRTILTVNGAHYSIIPVKWLTRLFVTGDIVTFWVQGGGGGLMASDSLASTGEKIVVGGLVLQVLLFGLFCATAVVFHRRFKTQAVGAVRSSSSGAGADVRWERILWMLYGVSALIMVRSIFRVVEFAMGQDGYPLSHEWTLYVFDTVPMFVVMVVFYIWYPGSLDPHPSNGRGKHLHSRDVESNRRHASNGAETDYSQGSVQMEPFKPDERRR
ncbi:RTA1 domain protein [Sporothrix schenckii 1099-18]|uniref:RTA1 domain protein n=1 Tax=Sporothrix schenckii 1099-18 TaxID=1397361 RepID=A0A0F2M2V6_SPOSC|nr:RTA1 domain protein [Sporothrix schenckii 1099-18]KJR84043.1 RTA1 domain protein [Sporothrix schenckii 1099-18]